MTAEYTLHEHDLGGIDQMTDRALMTETFLAVVALRGEVAELAAALAPVVALVSPLLGAAEQLSNMGPIARARAANGLMAALNADLV